HRRLRFGHLCGEGDTMTVFANGLEVSCKAQANKVIAAFPYVCFTPPQTPATPPGVPVPYPTFGLDGDTDKGTGTVKIGGTTVNQKNKSYYTKCTGNEAGCAPKKNIITSVNTGKEYAHAWSSDVKMDGEPVCRFTDIATNDHASPGGGGGPAPRVANPFKLPPKCDFLKIKPYNKLKCKKGEQKEHTVEVQFFTADGIRNLVLKCCEKYNDREAPCICMKAKWVAGEAAQARARGVTGQSVVGRTTNTPHYYKSAEARNWISKNPEGKLGDFVDKCAEATVDELGFREPKKSTALECLKLANLNYLKDSMGKSEKDVKDKKMCHTTCTRARAEEERVQLAKKKLKKTTVTAGQIARLPATKHRPTVGCKTRATSP
ncbi:MAG: PAAR-like domain-containing protein, partial [Amaricoccus sp.]